jgi:hypothetical protein
MKRRARPVDEILLEQVGSSASGDASSAVDEPLRARNLTAVEPAGISRAPKTDATNSAAEGQLAKLPKLAVEISPAAEPPQGRSTPGKLGAGETFSVIAKPAGRPLTNAEGQSVRWRVTRGDASVKRDDALTPNGTIGSFAALGTPGSAWLGLELMSGPAAGLMVANTKVTVIAPSSVHYVPTTGAIKHSKNSVSIGFRANLFIGPKDVSFAKVSFREDEATVVLTGWLKLYWHPTDGGHHPNAAWLNVDQNHRIPNDLVSFSGPDTRKILGVAIPFAEGSASFSIPIRYAVPGDEEGKIFELIEQKMVLNPDGTIEAWKGDSGAISLLASDPDA